MIIPQLNKFDTTIILICNTTENYVNLENHNFSLDFSDEDVPAIVGININQEIIQRFLYLLNFGIFSLVKFKRKKHLPSKIKYFKFWLK